MLKETKCYEFNFIKLTMSQFCKSKRGASQYEAIKNDGTTKQSKQQSFLLNFLEKQTLKSHINKCAPVNYRNNKKSFLRANKPSEINFGSTALGFKFSARTRQQIRSDRDQHDPPIAKITQNLAFSDKQNKPSSMNELKYRPFGKTKLQYCNTSRYESLNSLALQEKQTHRFEEIHLKKSNLKSNKYKITKSQSRSHLAKLIIKQQKNLTEVQQNHENKMKNRKLYEQRCVEKQNQQIKSTFLEKLKQSNGKEQNKNSQKIKPTPIDRDPEVKNELSQQNSQLQDLFDTNFSTIKVRDESSSKFISQYAIQELIDPISSSNFWNQSKVHHHKKRKIDIDKIRKKFPEHFFK